MASLMLLMDGRPWLRRWAMQVLTAEPAHFARLVAFHVGQRVPPTRGWRALLARVDTVCRIQGGPQLWSGAYWGTSMPTLAHYTL